MIEKINQLNELLVKWNQTDKSQRFGQFIESNSSMIVGQELYESFDSYDVYGKLIDRIEMEYKA